MHLWPVYAKLWLVSFSHKRYNRGVLTEELRKFIGKSSRSLQVVLKVFPTMMSSKRGAWRFGCWKVGLFGDLYIFAKKVTDILNGN